MKSMPWMILTWLWVGLGNSKQVLLDVRNSVAGLNAEYGWRWFKDSHVVSHVTNIMMVDGV